MTFPAACQAFHDQLMPARAFNVWLLVHEHIPAYVLNSGLFAQIVNWCSGT